MAQRPGKQIVGMGVPVLPTTWTLGSSSSSSSSSSSARSTSPAAAGGSLQGPPSVVQMIENLLDPETREVALVQLSKERLRRDDLAPMLWHSIATTAVLIQEISSVYPNLQSVFLTENQSTRACNALVLFQALASHSETKRHFIRASLPLYLFPFLRSTWTDRNHEYLRLTSLGVIGALVKVNDPEVIRFLLVSEIFPCCLRSMEYGWEMSKTVATYIVYKILINDEGLKYCCTLWERFYAIGTVMGNMVDSLAQEGNLGEDTTKRLLKQIICCYHRLSENPRACNGLRACLPVMLSDAAIIKAISDDQAALHRLHRLFQNVSLNHQRRAPPVALLIDRRTIS